MSNTPDDLPVAPATSLSTTGILAKGLVENLPVILSSFKEIYALRAKESALKAALEARCADMKINSQNFAILVQSLTELSKSESADEETKSMYRDLIRSLFELFTARSKESGSFSRFLNR
jgi:hypothetical protein